MKKQFKVTLHKQSAIALVDSIKGYRNRSRLIEVALEKLADSEEGKVLVSFLAEGSVAEVRVTKPEKSKPSMSGFAGDLA